MTKDEFTRIFRMGEWPDFYRLTQPLKSVIIDFDYAKTRKLLEPTWDGYSAPQGHDLIDDDCPIDKANLVTSQHRDDPNMHRVILDCDNGGKLMSGVLPHGKHLSLKLKPTWTFANAGTSARLTKAFTDHGMAAHTRQIVDEGWWMLEIDCRQDVAWIPSTTLDHHHLYMAVDMLWEKYTEFLNTMALSGLIQPGYAKASIKKGFSALRPPWVHKTLEQRLQTHV